MNNKDLKVNIDNKVYWINYEDWKAYEDFAQRKKIEALPMWLIEFLYENTNRNKDNTNS